MNFSSQSVDFETNNQIANEAIESLGIDACYDLLQQYGIGAIKEHFYRMTVDMKDENKWLMGLKWTSIKVILWAKLVALKQVKRN